MVGNSVVNFPPSQPRGALGRTSSSDRTDERRPDDRKGEGRTYANPLGLRAAPEARACLTSSPAYSRPDADAPGPEAGEGACRPLQSPRAARRAARGQPRTPAGACGPCTLACVAPHLRQAASGVRGQTAPGARPRRRPRRAGTKPRKDARHWAVPCHGAWQGTPASLGRGGGLKPCPRCAAGRLDPASAPVRVAHPLGDLSSAVVEKAVVECFRTAT